MRHGNAVMAGLLVIGVVQAARADVVVLTAIDSKSMAPSGQNWNDNNVRAYYGQGEVGYADGFMKFDFSSIPNGAVINSMVLTTYGFGNPYGNPEVRIYRVADDSWQRGPTDPYPGLDEGLTGLHTGFPVDALEPYDWDLDVGAADWSIDQTDDVLSLGMRNEKTSYSFVYWNGSDVAPAPPTLTVEYGGGQCPECPADLNDDGVVGPFDLAALLAAWGACP